MFLNLSYLLLVDVDL